jgi:hypothetical protein
VVALLLVFAVLANIKFLLDLAVAFYGMLLGVAWLPVLIGPENGPSRMA